MLTYVIILHNLIHMMKYETILRTINPYVDIWVYNIQHSFLCRHMKMLSIYSYVEMSLADAQYGFICRHIVSQ